MSIKKTATTIDHRVNITDLFATDIAETAKKTGWEAWNLPWNIYLTNSQKKESGLLQQFIRSGLWNDVKRSYFPAPIDAVSKFSLKEYQKSHNATEAEMSSFRYYLDMIMGEVHKLPTVDVKPYKPSKVTSINRAVTSLWGDWHIGTNLVPEESGVKFGPVEEARAVAFLVKTVLDYKTDHRDNTRLIINIIGDLIENMLHGYNGAIPVPLQIIRCTSLLRQAFAHLSAGYREVDVFWVAGNHDRNPMIHPKRAIHDRQVQSFSSIIALILKQELEHKNSNVKIHISLKPEIAYDLFDHRIHGGHGDLFTTVPNPGKTLNVKDILHQVLVLNNKEIQDGRKPFEVHHLGHVHTPGILYVDEYCKLAINGPLLPPGMFAQSIGIRSGVRGHLLYESTPEYAIGDNRLIYLNGSELNSSLDKIIQVLPEFEEKEVKLK
jgi:hypothetical protein